jgi:hypothetical protein
MRSRTVSPHNETGPLGPEPAWDVLERFALALQQAELAREQVRLTLDAVGEALSADAVFWHPNAGAPEFMVGGTSDRPGRGGPVELSAEWCRAFLVRALAGGAGPVCRTFLDPAAKPAAPWPCSAALVPVSKSRGSWLGALSFHPRRLFGPADVKVLWLARRLLLNRRQQALELEKLRDALGGLLRCLTNAPDAPAEAAYAASCLAASNSGPLGAGK